MAQPLAPRVKLDEDLRDRVKARRSSVRLAARAGFASVNQLAAILNDKYVRATPLTISRLRVLAALVDHDPERIFEDEESRS